MEESKVVAESPTKIPTVEAKHETSPQPSSAEPIEQAEFGAQDQNPQMLPEKQEISAKDPDVDAELKDQERSDPAGGPSYKIPDEAPCTDKRPVSESSGDTSDSVRSEWAVDEFNLADELLEVVVEVPPKVNQPEEPLAQVQEPVPPETDMGPTITKRSKKSKKSKKNKNK